MKGIPLSFVHVIGKFRDVFRIRSEPYPAPEIERRMDSQTDVLFPGYGIDEMTDPGGRRRGKIGALAVPEAISLPLHVDTCERRDRIGI
jgi:hypothetical protein